MMGGETLDILLSIVLFVLLVLFCLSNPHNKVNRWCAIGCFLFWLGVVKEVYLYSIIPMMDNAVSLAVEFMPVYSLLTWVLYALAIPTVIIAALHFNDTGKKHPKLLGVLQIVIYIPALVLSLFFSPVQFRDFQQGSIIFWYVFAAYNLSGAAVFAWLMIRAVRFAASESVKQQRFRVMIVIMPPVLFWVASVFLTHPFQLHNLYRVWQINAFILLFGVLTFVFMSFRDGFMGLRLSRENYHWNSDMDMVNRSATHIDHMLKNQTSKMELCIENIKSHYDEPPEEIAILSRSILNLKQYVDRMKRHSQSIRLYEQPCRLKALLMHAVPVLPEGVKLNIDIDDTMFWICDKSHMTEVFSNIFTNAVEAMRGSGTIEVTGKIVKSRYQLRITDSGTGIADADMPDIFTPYFTTKNTKENFGLGLSYCKNVVTKHDGIISAKSEQNKGTTFIISIPLSRTAAGTEAAEREV